MYIHRAGTLCRESSALFGCYRTR